VVKVGRRLVKVKRLAGRCLDLIKQVFDPFVSAPV
jgi:hypothetical protein